MGAPTGEKQLSRSELAERLNLHLFFMLDIPENAISREFSAMKLMLNSNRFDILVKFIYARYRQTDINSDWPLRLYQDHIWAFNRYSEDDCSGKEGVESFLDSFEKIIDSVQIRGFDPEESVIPVGNDNALIDGAHRIAACALFGKNPAVVNFDRDVTYDHRFFLERGLDRKWCDAVASEYCRLNDRARIAVLYPSAVGKEEEVRRILQDAGNIFYSREVSLNINGSRLLVRQIYSKENWLGDWSDDFAGVRFKASQCFSNNGPVRVYVFESVNNEMTLSAKEQIRDLFGIENHSVHINDTHQQSQSLAEILLNDNSIHFLNNARPRNFPEFFRLLEEYRSWLNDSGYDKRNFCIDGSSVMAAYGIREGRDLDFLHYGDCNLPDEETDIGSHNHEAAHYPAPVDDIIFNPENHFTYDGLKFASLEMVRKMKAARGEDKDREDVRLIEKFSKGSRFSFFSYNLKLTARRNIGRALGKIKSSMRHFLVDYLFSALKVVRKVEFRGYGVFYTMGTTIIESVRREGVYEKKKTDRIVESLGGVRSPLFLDIGANIGLVSLAVVSEIEDVHVMAFEPGNRQYRLFERTLRHNRLDNITPFNFALGDREGTAEFAEHSHVHSSGDGFFDTQRAGRARYTKVDLKRLDDVWEECGKPDITVMKVDTEGAELMVLVGGEKAIVSCRPVIFLELNKQNLKVYPYGAEDILKWVKERGYRVETLEGLEVDGGNIEKYMVHNDEFVAVSTAV